MRSSTVLVLLLAVAGCGGSGHEGNADMTMLPDMERGALDHPPLWRLQHLDAALQTAPEVWTVVWPGDEALGAQVADFLDWMLHSDYWMTTMGEYGIGAGTSKGLIVMPTAAPSIISDSTLAGIATSLVSMGQVTADANTQVAFIPPTTTKVTMASRPGGGGANPLRRRK